MFVNNYKDLINSDVNVVINSSATNFHYEINKECILRGKHLFTEKPCATEVS